jgi:L-iditol 2-dehydrogenase
MWVNTLVNPGQFVHGQMAAPDASSLDQGQVIVRFVCGAVCGSDLPKFRGKADRGDYGPYDGYPLHEVVGEVVETRSAALSLGDRVVGFAAEARGMREYFVTSDNYMIPVKSSVSDRDLVVVQSLATVLSALSRVGTASSRHVSGRHAAVIGQGPLGLLWAHVLKSQGAEHVTGVDQVDRTWAASAFSVDEPVWASSSDWSGSLRDEARPDLVVEAVGHEVGTLNDAIQALAPEGVIVAFGVPDDPYYPVAFVDLFRKNASLVTGVTKDWPRFLGEALSYLERHPALAGSYITHEFSVADVQKAYECAARPVSRRLKVVLASR